MKYLLEIILKIFATKLFALALLICRAHFVPKVILTPPDPGTDSNAILDHCFRFS